DRPAQGSLSAHPGVARAFRSRARGWAEKPLPAVRRRGSIGLYDRTGPPDGIYPGKLGRGVFVTHSCARESSVMVVGCRLLGLLGPRAVAQERTTDWAQFRGPGGLGVSPNRGLPLSWGPKENVLWKAALPGPGSSSPIVVGEKVFLTCYTGYNAPGQPR